MSFVGKLRLELQDFDLERAEKLSMDLHNEESSGRIIVG